MSTPLAIRNRNPGNIRPSNPPWNGTIGENSGFVVFDTMANGVRALCKQIIAYQEGQRHLHTVREIISTWAPPEDHNDTESYIAFVCAQLACKPDNVFKFRDPDFLYWIVIAIGEQESGHDAFTHSVSDADIDAGIAAALA